MANNFLPDKPDWQRFERSKLDRRGFVERFRRAESSISGHTHEFVTSRWRRIQQVRRPIIVWVLLIVLVLMATSVDLFFSQQRYQTLAGAKDSTFIEGVVGKISTLNPLFSETEADKLASQLIFSRLYQYDETGALKGDLAKSILTSPDELTYTIALRDDVKWHDGTNLTAEDVKYTVDLFKNQAVGSFTGQVLRGVSAKVISDYAVEFSLRSPYAPFPHLLDFAILPKHLLSKIEGGDLRGSDYSQAPVGSGKFKVKSFTTTGADTPEAKQVLSLTANDKYYQKRDLGHFELHVYNNQEKLLKGLKAGEVNAIATTLAVANDQLPADKFERKVASLNNGVMAFFNVNQTMVKDVRMRQALRTAMGVEQLRQQKFDQDGVFSEFNLPILKGQLGNQNIVYDTRHKLETAETQLTALGYRRQDGRWVDAQSQPLKLNLVSVRNTQYQSAAEFIAKKLEEFGVKVELRLVDLKADDFGTAQEIFKAKNYDILVYEMNLGADPDVYGFWHSSQVNELGLNFSNYKNKIADEALASARLKQDLELRTAKYNIFLKQWLDDVPAVGLFQTNLYYFSQKGVTGYSGHRLIDSTDRYYQVLDWAGERQTVYKTP